MFHFNPEYNLLQKYYDAQCELFYNGDITYSDFEKLEFDYAKRVNLFIINLN